MLNKETSKESATKSWKDILLNDHQNPHHRFGNHPDFFEEVAPARLGSDDFMDAPRSREDVRDDLEAITDQINEGIEKGRYTLSQLQTALVSKTKQAAASTDQLVHDNPWGAIGVAVALGMLMGYLLSRR